MTKQNLPLQPLYLDQNGTIRFQENAVVSYLVDISGVKMNDIIKQGFSEEDIEQFVQLIGYSFPAFESFKYAKESTIIKAKIAFNNEDINPLQAKCDALEAELEHYRKKLEKIVTNLEEIIDGD